MAGHDITDEDWLTERLADVTEDEIDLFMSGIVLFLRRIYWNVKR